MPLLWTIINDKTKQLLTDYQKDWFDGQLKLPRDKECDVQISTQIESLEEIDHIIRQAPSRSRR